MTEPLPIDRDRSALLLVDIQPDFMPGGALAVPEGDRIMPGVRALMLSGAFRHQVATQDWHPPGHVSFASSHPGRSPFEVIELYGHEQTLWPDHCVQDTPGAALHPDLPWRTVDLVVRKGQDRDVDSYSGFRNNWSPAGERPPTGLAGYLAERGIERVFLCGLARDVCVKWTAEDAVAAGLDTWLLWDLTRPVDAGSDPAVREGLEARGVHMTESARLAAAE
jgi:nicotinamidase/pyrazinamidase